MTDQHLAGLGECRDARGDVDGDALHIVVDLLDFASMETAADLNVKRTNRLGNGAGATHGTRRTVEGGEKPIPQRFHFVAAVPRELPP
ncbi:MAG TPA: hypothetical protein VNY82_09605, partial [Steroidobacteraceae bacterium]|nr:hypothetical protein [Steroidobacteraceae bacterium]